MILASSRLQPQKLDTNHISRPASPAQPPNLPLPQLPLADKPSPLKMQQSTQTSEQLPRYQLFPRERQLPILNSGKPMMNEKAMPLNMVSRDERSPSGLKARINQHSLVRRRKISVPELGPMTTVQEVPMDSPTIPGRPALHERSISAPGDDWKQTQLIDSLLGNDDGDLLAKSINDTLRACTSKLLRSSPSKQYLAPLVIPPTMVQSPQLLSKMSWSRARSGSVPTDASRVPRQNEPSSLRTPFTPSPSASTATTPKSGTTDPFSATTVQTPISTATSESHRSSPKPWDARPSPLMMQRSATPQGEKTSRATTPHGHQRRASESTTSIMDRGRPRKRSEHKKESSSSVSTKRADASAERAAEQKAFEDLPVGTQPKQAVDVMGIEELVALQKQALGQTERFEVLSMQDVDSLSKELRRLDERVEYLRRTYTSLRSGRRNLQARICQFLRSPRVAKFNHESMLKQEDALAELDVSIDDWVTKLERADNRRTRVRQKLLEHVAAAAILQLPVTPSASTECLPSSKLPNVSTPPRSPSRQAARPSSRAASGSPSPTRVVARLHSTIVEHPVQELEARRRTQASMGPADLDRTDAESIRIYAGDDIYTLLADVENEITRMSQSVDNAPSKLRDLKRKELARQQSHEILSGLVDAAAAPAEDQSPKKGSAAATTYTPTRTSSTPPPPPEKDHPTTRESQIFLSNTFYRP